MTNFFNFSAVFYTANRPLSHLTPPSSQMMLFSTFPSSLSVFDSKNIFS